MRAQLALLPSYLTGHLQLTLLALLAALAISLPLGVLASRRPRLERVVLAAAGVIQTVPSLALLAVMVPLLAALDLRSIGFLPAILGLTLYGLLPTLRNTVTGIAGVDPALKEAARGVGMTPLQQLGRVELPLAMPVIVAGVRTATVWTVGVATLSTPVGATSLGNYIFSGLQTRNFAAVLVGSVAAALLALLLDGLVRTLESALRERRRRRVGAVLGAFALLYGYVGLTLGARLLPAAEPPVVIGAKTFTEQYVLAAILAGRIHERTGLPTETMPSLGSTVAFDALRAGEIDAYVDYSGTIWATIMKRSGPPPSRKACVEEVSRYLEREHDITLVASLGFENAYALAMRSTDAKRLGIERISQLAPFARRLRIGGDYEFFARPEWKALVERYGLAFAERRAMDPALMYQAVAHGAVDVIGAFTTDGRIRSLGLRVLEDDRGAIPPYDAVVLASARLRRERPEVLDALRELAGAISAERMRALNAAVDEGGETPEAAAERFLAEARR